MAFKYSVEVGLFDLHYDIAKHLHESAVAVISESVISGFLGKTFNSYIVESQVEDGIHHSRHGYRCSGSYGYEQRVLIVSELLAHNLFEFCDVLPYLIDDCLIKNAAVFGILSAYICCDGETERYRKTDIGHLSEVGALSAKQVPHVF